MADILTITADKAQEILGGSVVSASLNEAGHLILARQNGQTIDAGDFNAIVGDIQASVVADAVASQVTTQVNNKVAGTLNDFGTKTGAITFTGVTTTNIVNSMMLVTLVGNASINVASLPAGCRVGTQFALRVKQDATGNRSLTLTGFKKSFGLLNLTTTPNAIDILVFLWDGDNWYVGPMGMDFR